MGEILNMVSGIPQSECFKRPKQTLQVLHKETSEYILLFQKGQPRFNVEKKSMKAK